MAQADVLEIWNNAVLNIGGKAAISTVFESSAEAAACALRYPSVVQAILRGTDWNCVRRRVGLREVSAGAVWPPSWSYMYVHPDDCLVIRGFDFGVTAARFPNWTETDYEIADDATAGKVILMNVTCPTMIYTSFVLDLAAGTYEAKFDAALKEALSWALAAAIAGPLTGNRALAADVGSAARAMLDQAKAGNANEGSPSRMPQDCDSVLVRGYSDLTTWRGLT